MAGLDGADAVLDAGNDDVTTQPARAQRRRGPALRLAGAVVALSLLGACSSVPDTLDPTTWYGPSKEEAAKAGETGDGGEPTSELQAERGEAPPGADADYPTLGSVDRKAQARDNMQGGLVADPQAPQYAAAIPRQGESAAPKEPPQPTPEAKTAEPAEAPAPASQPVLPVTPVPQEESSAAPEAPERTTAAAAPKREEPMPIAQPKPEAQESVTVAAATPEPEAPMPSRSPSDNLGSVDSSGGIDQSEMAERMKQRLAEIRARSSAQGSLMTSELQQTQGGELSTVVVSSAGVQQADGEQHTMLLPGAEQPLPPDARFVENRGALPLPTDAVRVATILFDHGTARLTSRDRRILQDVVNLHHQRGGKLRIIGHASQRTGNMEIDQHKQVNFKVSVARANRIAQELKRMGVPQDDVLVAAVGDTQPVFFEFMPSGEAGNRRTEIYLSN